MSTVINNQSDATTQVTNQAPSEESNQNQLLTSTSETNLATTTPAAATAPPTTNTTTTNVVTIPVPIVHTDENYCYVTVKGSLHDRSCSVFGLNDAEIQALTKRFESSVKPVVNGVMVSVPPMLMLNTLAELSYKVICSCGEAEICWTMQREV